MYKILTCVATIKEQNGVIRIIIEHKLIKCYVMVKIASSVSVRRLRNIEGCLGWGSRTSILTSYLKSIGLFTPGVKFSSNSVEPLLGNYNTQAHSKEGTENLNLGSPSHLTWHSEVTSGAWYYCCHINLKHIFWKSEGWLTLKLPITLWLSYPKTSVYH